MAKRKTFDLLDYMMSKKGLYEEAAGEENEPIGDGTPTDEKGTDPDLEPENDEAAKISESVKRSRGKKRGLKEGKKVCRECGDSPAVVINVNDEDEVSVNDASEEDEIVAAPETLADWFRLGEEADEYNNETEPEGLSPEEAKSDNQKTDEELAKEGGGQSPAAELKEMVKKFRKYARFLREEADETEEKAEEAEEKAEDEDEDEKKEKLEEVARRLYKKAKRLREEAEDAEEKAEEVSAEMEKSSDEDEEASAEDEEDEAEAAEAVTEWTKTVALTGRKLLKEQKKRRLVKQLKDLLEEEEVAAGTPSDEVDLDAFGSEDVEDNQRAAAAAPTTEEELPD